MICTFFGHRDTPESIQPILEKTICELIELRGVDTFYVGDKGSFDNMVLKTLRSLREKYPQMKFGYIPSYQPIERNEPYQNYDDAFFPEEVLKSPRKYAISRRNYWLVNQADIVVTYVTGIGNSRNFKELAIKKGKEVIELSQMPFFTDVTFSLTGESPQGKPFMRRSRV